MMPSCTPSASDRVPDAEVVLPVYTSIADSALAAREILDDDLQGFFERITLIDMAIQMKQPIGLGETREDRLPAYRQYLAQDVADFTEQEAQLVAQVLHKALADIYTYLSAKALPDTLILIKTKGNHYGSGTWYTREECIIIPADALTQDEAALYSVMLHEIFHVWSRYHPAQRDSLYQLIGFKRWGAKTIVYSPVLAPQLLLNPDGLEPHYYIELLNENGQTFPATPIIYTRAKNSSPGKPDFFSYLSFDLFPEQLHSDTVEVIATPDGRSPIDLRQHPEFFQKITQNTQYIIHPDEILADNFTFAVLSEKDPSLLDSFQADGKGLILKIKEFFK